MPFLCAKLSWRVSFVRGGMGSSSVSCYKRLSVHGALHYGWRSEHNGVPDL
jgi:acid phosphatase family membrane protein YuiD